MPTGSAIQFCYATDVVEVLSTDLAFRGRVSFAGSLGDLLGHEALAAWGVWVSAVVTDTVEGLIEMANGHGIWRYEVSGGEIELIDEMIVAEETPLPW